MSCRRVGTVLAWRVGAACLARVVVVPWRGGPLFVILLIDLTRVDEVHLNQSDKRLNEGI